MFAITCRRLAKPLRVCQNASSTLSVSSSASQRSLSISSLSSLSTSSAKQTRPKLLNALTEQKRYQSTLPNWMQQPYFTWTRTYQGPLQCAILDWSGTTADNYVIAPAYAFVEVFNMHGVPITMEEARVPMGLRKDLHIQALTRMPQIAERWKQKKGKLPDQTDVDNMFRDFIPAQLKCLPNYTGLIPGAKEAVQALRQKYNLKIGMTTGFQRVMVNKLLEDAKKQGYEPDLAVAGDDVDYPRPYPHMVFANMHKLGILNVQAVVKVDDTVTGVSEGLNAGTWAVGLSHTSNYMNINSYEEDKKMPKEERARRGAEAREKLLKTGCHYVVDDITHLPSVVEDINRRLRQGDRP